MPKKHLTTQFLRSLKPQGKRIEYYDQHVIKNGRISQAGVIGLNVRLSATGSVTFYYRYYSKNKFRSFRVGRFPDISLADAREEARRLLAQVNAGTDPQVEKQAKKTKKETLFSELADNYSKRHLPELRQRTRDEYQRVINKELLPPLGRHPVKKITRAQIINLLDAIAIDRKAPVQANRTRAVLSSIFSFGIDKALVEANPVLTVKKKRKGQNGEPVEKKRKRTYSPDEIKALWGAIHQQPEPVRSLFLMLFLCGQRLGETRQMQWQHISFDKQTWTIPKELTKAKREQVVPLSARAITILERIGDSPAKRPYVFPNARHKDKPIRWVQQAVYRIQNASGVDDFRAHDIRRTVATYMAELGVSRTVLGKVLNHKGLADDDQVTAIYDRHDYIKEKRIAINLWSDQLGQIIGESGTKMFKIGG